MVYFACGKNDEDDKNWIRREKKGKVYLDVCFILFESQIKSGYKYSMNLEVTKPTKHPHIHTCIAGANLIKNCLKLLNRELPQFIILPRS